VWIPFILHATLCCAVLCLCVRAQAGMKFLQVDTSWPVGLWPSVSWRFRKNKKLTWS